MSASVIIIDDHPLVRDGIKRSLLAAGFSCPAEAGSQKEAIATPTTTPRVHEKYRAHTANYRILRDES